MEKMNFENESLPRFSASARMDSTERVVEMLDEVERRIESLRNHAQSMEKERNDLMEALSYIKHTGRYLVDASQADKEDLKVSVDRLERRCNTVEINVSTPRNASQMRALTDANRILDELACQIKQSVARGKNLVTPYLNACQSESDSMSPVDQKFQTLLIECTGDDQKKIKDKLQHWHGRLEQTEFNL